MEAREGTEIEVGTGEDYWGLGSTMKASWGLAREEARAKENRASRHFISMSQPPVDSSHDVPEQGQPADKGS